METNLLFTAGLIANIVALLAVAGKLRIDMREQNRSPSKQWRDS